MDCLGCIYASPCNSAIWCTKLQQYAIGVPPPCMRVEHKTIVTDRTSSKISDLLEE